MLLNPDMVVVYDRIDACAHANPPISNSRGLIRYTAPYYMRDLAMHADHLAADMSRPAWARIYHHAVPPLQLGDSEIRLLYLSVEMRSRSSRK